MARDTARWGSDTGFGTGEEVADAEAEKKAEDEAKAAKKSKRIPVYRAPRAAAAATATQNAEAAFKKVGTRHGTAAAAATAAMKASMAAKSAEAKTSSGEVASGSKTRVTEVIEQIADPASEPGFNKNRVAKVLAQIEREEREREQSLQAPLTKFLSLEAARPKALAVPRYLQEANMDFNAAVAD